jgi:ribA/ribD-fused uncharacterized protein
MKVVPGKYVFFWKSFLSQWTRDSFYEDGIEFKTCEHYMMYHKAMLFGDTEIAAKVLATDGPQYVKQYGRMVKNYNQRIWDENKFRIVVEGNILRFAQNQSSLKRMLKYQTETFVEASPFDPIWGIGMDETHPDILDESKWKGENLLGKALTEVRNKFLNL